MRISDWSSDVCSSDLTEDTLRRRFASAVRAPGPATSRVRQLVDERKQQEAARTVDHIAASLGPVGNVERQAEQLSAQARAAAAPLYEISNAQQIGRASCRERVCQYV